MVRTIHAADLSCRFGPTPGPFAERPPHLLEAKARHGGAGGCEPAVARVEAAAVDTPGVARYDAHNSVSTLAGRVLTSEI